MHEPKALVKNAADVDQVKNAKIKEKMGREQELADVKEVLSTRGGRRFLWRLLGQCKVHGSIWENSAKIHYNAGQQDVGHRIMAEIIEANEESYFQMMREAKGELKNV